MDRQIGRGIDAWMKKVTGLNEMSTYVNAPGLQLFLCGSQIEGDGCTGIVDTHNCENLAIVEL